MQKETEQFYLEHKDKTWKLPKFPDNIDETNGDEVTKWILEQMKEGNMGWIEINLMNVKGGDFIPIAWHHMGQIETQVMTHREFYTKFENPGYINAYGCTLYGEDNDRTNLVESATGEFGWVPEVHDEANNIASFYDVHFPCSTYKTIRFIKIEPNGSLPVHCDNINDDKDKILNPIKDIFPILVSMREPGKKCHTVVEGFGIVPIKEGRTYLLNPYRKHVVVNTSDTEECVRLRTQAIPGKRFGEFVNCITRTYFELEGRLGQDYLRQLPIKPKKGPKQTVMDY